MLILHIEDHPLFARAFEGELLRLVPEARIHHAADLAIAETALADQCFDLVIADLSITDVEGVIWVDVLKNRWGIPVAVVSASTDANVVRYLYERGIAGFIAKASNMDEFSQKLYLLLAGDRVFPDYVHVPDAKRTAQLSTRELEVMRCLADGLQNKNIARELGMSMPTVASHIQHIYAKLGVNSRVVAVSKARASRLIEDVAVRN